MRSEDEFGNSFNSSQGSGSEKTVKASKWLALSHGIAPTIADSDPVASETPSQGSDSNTDFKCTP